jgi:hypothetical protein
MPQDQVLKRSLTREEILAAITKSKPQKLTAKQKRALDETGQVLLLDLEASRKLWRGLEESSRIWRELITEPMLSDHRNAVENGDVALMFVTDRVCERMHMVWPDWLTKALADWARRNVRGNAQTNRLGRHANLATEVEYLLDALETYWTHEAIKAIGRRSRYERGENAKTITARILNVSVDTVKHRIASAKKYVRPSKAAQMLAFSKFAGKLPATDLLKMDKRV